MAKSKQKIPAAAGGQSGRIIIPAPSLGIALSPYFGEGYAADIRNLDTKSIPGIAMLSLAAAKKSGTTITGIPKWAVIDLTDTNQTVYVVDSDHKLYKADTSGSYATWTLITHGGASTGHGNGLGIFKGFVILPGDTKVDAWKISTTTWSNDFTTAQGSLDSDTLFHPVLPSVDDKLYIGAGKWIASVVELTTFDAADNATFTFTAHVCSIRTNEKIKCLEELGVNILAGSWAGSSVSTPFNVGRIYPFNRTSYSLGIPLDTKEAGVNQMLNVNNLVYIQAGSNGRYYYTDGTNVRFLTQLPSNPYQNKVTYAYPGAIMFSRGRIYSGLNIFSNGNTPDGPKTGVFSFNLDGSNITLENTISASNGTDANSFIGCLLGGLNGANNQYVIGWQSGTDSAQGVDLVGADNYATSFSAFFDSEVFNLASALEKNQPSQLEVFLERGIAANEAIRVCYRTDTNSSFTTYQTYNTSGTSAKKVSGTSWFDNFSIPNGAENLQFRIYISGTTTTSKYKFIRIT